MPDPFIVLASRCASAVVPRADADDSMAGAKCIPAEVTHARLRGNTIPFIQGGSTKEWHWVMPDGRKVYNT